MNYDELMEVFRARRSIRRFKADPVPDEDIDKLIEAARLAPSGFNTQPWEFVILKDKELKDKIVRVIDDYKISQFDFMEQFREEWQGPVWQRASKDPMDYGSAPVFILLLGDERMKAGLPMMVRYLEQKRESIFNSSLSNAFTYMHLAAATLGLGTQWVTAVQVPVVSCFIKNLLGIPEALKIHDMLVVGHPAMEPKGKFLRAREDMVHHDYCGEGDFKTDEEVREHIRRVRTWAQAVNPDKKKESSKG